MSADIVTFSFVEKLKRDFGSVSYVHPEMERLRLARLPGTDLERFGLFWVLKSERYGRQINRVIGHERLSAEEALTQAQTLYFWDTGIGSPIIREYFPCWISWCRFGPHECVSIDMLYSIYARWCSLVSDKAALPVEAFESMMTAIDPSIKVVRRSRFHGDKKRVRSFKGVSARVGRYYFPNQDRRARAEVQFD